MNALLTHLVVFAKLMSTVVCESCADPQHPTAITIDPTGKIGARRLPRVAVPRHPVKHGLQPAHTIG